MLRQLLSAPLCVFLSVSHSLSASLLAHAFSAHLITIHEAGSSHTIHEIWKRRSLWFPRRKKKKLWRVLTSTILSPSLCLPMWKKCGLFWTFESWFFLISDTKIIDLKNNGSKSSFRFYLTLILTFWGWSCCQRRQTDRWWEGQRDTSRTTNTWSAIKTC